MNSSANRIILFSLLFMLAMTALHSQVVYFSGKDKTTGGIEGLDTPEILTFGIDLISMNSTADKLIFKIKTENNISLSIRLFSLNGELISNNHFFVPQGNKDIEIYEPLMDGTYLAVFSDGIRSKSIMISKSDEISIGKTHEFQLVKPGKFEFNDWKIYLSSMNFWSNYKEYWSNGVPPNQEPDSNIHQDYYDTKELDFIKSDFDSYECWNNDTNKLKFKFSYCSHKDDIHCKDFMECFTTLNFHLNFDTINNNIKELKIEYSYFGHTITTYGGIELDYSYNFILQNIPYINMIDGSIIAEVKANDYKNVLKEYHNYYMFNNSEHTSFPIFKYIDWLKLNKINNDIFFRLVLSK